VTRQVSFHRLALQELNEAARYYGLESPDLGVEFLTEIERCTRSTLDSPESAPILIGSVRRRLAHRFPYAVLYTIKPSRIRILAIMHLKRRPMYWAGRR
jgi:plasmid stabilization system protein ParE